MEPKPWKIIKTETVFKNQYWNVLQETVETAEGGPTSEFFVNDKVGGALIFAMTEDGKVVLNRQYKHGAQEVVTELAIGSVKEGEDPLEAAKRELAEETGYGGGEWESLGVWLPNPTSSRAHLYAFLARNVRKISDQEVNPWEVVETSLVDPRDLPGMITSGAIKPTAAMAAIFFALMKLGILEVKA